MPTSRRDFLKTTAVASGAASLGIAPRVLGAERVAGEREATRTARAPKPLKILILGGTGFIGPHQVRYAVERGHKVTVFNRGKRQADLPKQVEHLQGDRNGQLDALKGKRTWDVVIDNPTMLPSWVKSVGEILQGRTNQYLFISTISVYAHYKTAGMDETYELSKYTGKDAYAETMENGRQFYGPLKVLSEAEAETWFPGKVTVVRPGLIVGPGDESDRFTYWPVRIDKGGEILAPGTPNDPVQIIDVRDLSEFVIRMVEQGDYGIYNATGPKRPLTIAEELYGCKAVTPGSNDAYFTWVPSEFLAAQEARPWMEMTTWVPNRGDNDGWSRVSIERSLAKGLTFRPLAVTAKDTLDWWKTLPSERTNKPKAGMPSEKEQKILAAWHAQSDKKAP